MSNFQQRHYEVIAELLQDAQRHVDLVNGGWADAHIAANETLGYVTDLMSGLFDRDNGRFDRGRFERACVVGDNVKARTK